MVSKSCDFGNRNALSIKRTVWNIAIEGYTCVLVPWVPLRCHGSCDRAYTHVMHTARYHVKRRATMWHHVAICCCVVETTMFIVEIATLCSIIVRCSVRLRDMRTAYVILHLCRIASSLCSIANRNRRLITVYFQWSRAVNKVFFLKWLTSIILAWW